MASAAARNGKTRSPRASTGRALEQGSDVDVSMSETVGDGRAALRHAHGSGMVTCGCGVTDDGDGRKAVAVDPDAKDRNLKRLRRIEGQVRGLQKMVDENRYCADVLTQISSVHEALRSVGRELMRNHLKHCAASAIQAGDGEAMYDELVDMMYKHSR